jgi:hypothetical protein
LRHIFEGEPAIGLADSRAAGIHARQDASAK